MGAVGELSFLEQETTVAVISRMRSERVTAAGTGDSCGDAEGCGGCCGVAGGSDVTSLVRVPPGSVEGEGGCGGGCNGAGGKKSLIFAVCAPQKI